MAEFKMPSLGADMASGTLYEWQVAPGDSFKRGDVIAEVETDKGVIDVEIWEDGVIEALLVEPGVEVPVGAALATYRTAGEPAAAEEKAAEPAAAAATPAQAAQPAPSPSPLRPSPPQPASNGKRVRISPLARRRAEALNVNIHTLAGSGPGGAIGVEDVEKAAAAQERRVRVSPVARRMAEDLGIDLSQVTGSGRNGAITRADVECAAEKLRRQPEAEPAQALTECVEEGKAKAEPAPIEAAAPAAAEKKPADFQARMRQAIAAAMARANREIPHYYLETRIDVTDAVAWLEAENAQRSIKDRILPVVLLLKATAKALADNPELNGFWVDDALQVAEAIHIGFAVALRQGGLVTPAIHNADMKSLDELMADVRDVIMRTRAGRLRSSDLTDATITLTSLGDMGVEKVYGVIYPPQVALVGFGKVMEQPWAQNGMIGVRKIITATLAGDHRASDGLRGARFLDALTKHLQEAEKL